MTDKDRGVYSPPPDEYDRFDINEEDDSRRGPWLLVVAVAVLIAFIAVTYTAYNQGFRSGGRADAPIIAAQPGPLKAAPKNPGGTPPVDSGSAAYEPLDNTKPKQVKTAPPPEQPASRAPVAAKPKPKPVAQTTPKPTPKPVSKPKTRPAFDIQTDGKFVVQLGAFRSEEQALITWDSLAKSLPVLMDGTASDIQRADLGAKGVYYRLRAAAFDDRGKAQVFCTALKSKGRDCIVVAR
ncbi:hypothetical protein MNBD_ALPHA06-374 [hydrothermal vent metagenome]|uniref:SPOR domain-containing protein n=1 Tax=hydrothermal vent metagenome TaxID=652676 RepID=A0A3B0SAP8_9ZZZZ